MNTRQNSIKEMKISENIHNQEKLFKRKNLKTGSAFLAAMSISYEDAVFENNAYCPSLFMRNSQAATQSCHRSAAGVRGSHTHYRSLQNV